MMHGPPPGCDVSYFSSYVMQRDVQLDCLTVEETLRMAADLKLQNNTAQERYERVYNVMKELGLLECRNINIGGDFKKGISGGQLKRLSIGVELLDDPSLLFLDEPTSGLDSALAFDIFKSLMYLARSGRTIICTVHQPRSQVFAMFDKLLLLSQGSVVYHGEANLIVDYFSRNGFPCPLQFNPADYILDLLSPKAFAAINQAKVVEELAVLTAEQRRRLSGGDGGRGEGGASQTEANSTSGGGGGGGKDPEEGQGGVATRHSLTGLDTGLYDSASTISSSSSKAPLEDCLDSERVVLSQTDIDSFPALYVNSQEAAAVRLAVGNEIDLDATILNKGRNRKYTSLPPELQKVAGQLGFGPTTQYSRSSSRSQLGIWTYTAWIICKRTAINSIRHPMTGFMVVIVNIIMGLFLGGIWFDIGDASYRNYTGSSPVPRPDVLLSVNNIMGSLFFLVVDIPFSSFHCLGVFQTERLIFNRETSSRLYSTSAFFAGKTIADLPFQIIPACLLMVLFYWMANLTRSAQKFFIYIGIGLLNVFASSSYCYAISALVPNIEMANLLAPVYLVILMLVSGFFLKDPSIPCWISWLSYASWLRYGFCALAVNEFPLDGSYAGYSNEEILKEWVMVPDTRVWFNCVMLLVVGVAMRIIAFFLLKYCNRRKGLEQ
eukprot:GHVS01053731.1.p1 GENE.GHVS01053731.1~~GHVS01053731.1.p1  ORF type:complete len:663 (+),score=85.60 GHVS01053731.1:1-1989(+)